MKEDHCLTLHANIRIGYQIIDSPQLSYSDADKLVMLQLQNFASSW
jgi:hypothetical protein